MIGSGALQALGTKLSRAAIYCLPCANRKDEKTLDAAARVRINTAKMADINWYDLFGVRGGLKIRIAQALIAAGKLPVNGLIEIDRLAYTSRIADKPAVFATGRYVSPLSRPSTTEVNQKIITGFTYGGENYTFDSPIVYD